MRALAHPGVYGCSSCCGARRSQHRTWLAGWRSGPGAPGSIWPSWWRPASLTRRANGCDEAGERCCSRCPTICGSTSTPRRQRADRRDVRRTGRGAGPPAPRAAGSNARTTPTMTSCPCARSSFREATGQRPKRSWSGRSGSCWRSIGEGRRDRGRDHDHRVVRLPDACRRGQACRHCEPARRNVLVANGRFRQLWLARAISFIGDGIALTALVLHVEAEEGTGTAVAALLLAQALPHLLGPVAGTFADRVDQRRLMIGCDLARAALFAAMAMILPAMAVWSPSWPWHRPRTPSSDLPGRARSPLSRVGTTWSVRTHGWGPR